MASVRRAVKNVRKGFAPCEVDVRDATSNNKSMASIATMVRVSNATYDVTTSPMVMAMLWKRLNDIGKNWRHVYKGLLLLDYLLKTGAEHIVTEVKENKFALDSLLEFRYVDSRGIDKGVNVREQAKATIALLTDEARLKDERVKSMQTQHRLTKSLGRKATPKPTQHTRAERFAARANVMPNGELAPDLKEKEYQAVRNAQIQSLNEFASSPAGQQALLEAQIYNPPSQQTTPGGVSNANMSEEEALAYALRMSAIEAGNAVEDSNYHQHIGETAPFSVSAPPQRSSTAASGMTSEQLSAREEEELAMALSLSLAEVQGANQILDSDGESDTEDTPPSSPYQGEFFAPSEDGAAPVDGYLTVHPPALSEFEELPSYDDSLKQLSPQSPVSAYDTIQAETDLMAQYLASQGVSTPEVVAAKDKNTADDSDDEL